MDKIKKFIESRDKKEWIVAGIIGVVAIGSTIYSITHSNASERKNIKDDSIEFASSTKHTDLKEYFTSQLNNKIEYQRKAAEKSLRENNVKAGESITKLEKDNQSLHEQIAELKKQVMEKRKDNINPDANKDFNMASVQYNNEMPPLPPARKVGRIVGANNGYEQSNISELRESVPQIMEDELEVVSVDLDGSMDEEAVFKDVSTYVASGTHVKGVLLGGIDAHTEVYGQNETRVVTIRFTEEGVMPNGHKAKLKNCVLLASAWGNSSSERVAMQGERLTCIGKSGKILETKVLGITYGPDGRQDVRGRIVYPEGKLVQRAFVAGTLSGIGSGVSENFVTRSTSPLGSTASVDTGGIFKYGAAQGASKGLDKLADYYIKRAEQLQPIIQVSAGVEVDVVFQKGFFLDGKQHKEFDTESNKPSTPYDADTRVENHSRSFDKRRDDAVSTAHQEALSVLNKLSGDAR